MATDSEQPDFRNQIYCMALNSSGLLTTFARNAIDVLSFMASVPAIR
jgi:hypothetical protein